MTEETKPAVDNDRPAPREQAKALLKQLIDTYPVAFIPFGERGVKPLKLGIHKDLLPVVKNWGFDTVALKIAMSSYTRALRYQRALVKETHRIDLQGEPAGEISDANRETARTQINQIEEKRKQSQQAETAEQPKRRPQRRPKQAPPKPRGVSDKALAALQEKFGGVKSSR